MRSAATTLAVAAAPVRACVHQNPRASNNAAYGPLTPYGLRPIAAAMDSRVQTVEVDLQVGCVVLPRQAVYPRSGMALERQERLPQQVDRHVVQQRGKPFLLQMALREVFAKARTHNQAAIAAADLTAWISWARRSRLESFKVLAKTLKTHFDAVVRGMLDNRSNAFVEAMNGLMQQAKRAARGLRTATSFINIAYLRLSKLAHLPASPFAPVAPR